MKHCILLSPFSGRLTEEEQAELRARVAKKYRRIGNYNDSPETFFKYAMYRAELIKANKFADYRDDCLRELLRKRYAPFAPHAIYPQVLDDSIPEDRKLGMAAGYAVYSALMPCPVFVGDDHGIAAGMREEIEFFMARVPILFHSKGEWPA